MNCIRHRGASLLHYQNKASKFIIQKVFKITLITSQILGKESKQQSQLKLAQL